MRPSWSGEFTGKASCILLLHYYRMLVYVYHCIACFSTVVCYASFMSVKFIMSVYAYQSRNMFLETRLSIDQHATRPLGVPSGVGETSINHHRQLSVTGMGEGPVRVPESV